MWPHDVAVSTLDSESSDRGSNQREASLCRMESTYVAFTFCARPLLLHHLSKCLRQWAELVDVHSGHVIPCAGNPRRALLVLD